MRPLHHYLVGTASWFTAFGIQSVMFAWLVTMVLHETPEKVGIAQMSLLLPGTLLMLVGGSYADRFGGRRVVVAAQSFAVLASVYLLLVVSVDRLSFTSIIGYAVLMGLAQAFVTPARDGLLNQVAGSRLQRTVMLTSTMQFGMQLVGFLIASFSEAAGPELVLSIQAMALAVGVVSFARLPAGAPPKAATHPRLMHSVREGARTVMLSPSMRMVMLQNVAVGVFFMGSYMVTIPLLLREVFDGNAQDLAVMNGANSLGLVSTVILLLRLGDVRRQGRALLLFQGIGALVLVAAANAPSFPLLVLALFLWGTCGGIGLTMSRIIMQEQAPPEQRARVMSFYALSFMGAGPIGAVLCGYLVELFAPQLALMVASSSMFVVILLVGVGSRIWHLEGHVHQVLAEDAQAPAGEVRGAV